MRSSIDTGGANVGDEGGPTLVLVQSGSEGVALASPSSPLKGGRSRVQDPNTKRGMPAAGVESVAAQSTALGRG